MSKHEKSLKVLSGLAEKVLQQKSSTAAARQLADAVLMQAERKTGADKKGHH